MSLSCDVFSFGMILFEIHSCELPYADVTPMMINVRIATGQVGVCVCVFVAFDQIQSSLRVHTMSSYSRYSRNAFGLQ